MKQISSRPLSAAFYMLVSCLVSDQFQPPAVLSLYPAIYEDVWSQSRFVHGNVNEKPLTGSETYISIQGRNEMSQTYPRTWPVNIF